MKVTVYGSGYVGLVTGSLLADVGNDVLCVDIDETKVANLKKGIIPIHEPGLDKVIIRNVEIGRLNFTTDMDQAVAHSEMQFIACLLYTSPSPRDKRQSRMPSSA